MILADSSVWISHFRDQRTAARIKLEAATAEHLVLVGDLILLEVLQGARDEAQAQRIERELRSFTLVPLLDSTLASEAARNYRKLRALGITVGKIANLIIGTFCIARGHQLLHDAADFAPMEKPLGLQIL